MMRFVDTNVFIYSMTRHPKFGVTATKILKRIEEGERAATSTLVLCEIAWVLESMGKQGLIKPCLEKIVSFRALRIVEFDSDDLLVGANNVARFGLDFNDGVNLSVMTRLGISEAYSNDQRHLGKVDFVRLTFE
jgi:predicted nucleic acid-binding protein